MSDEYNTIDKNDSTKGSRAERKVEIFEFIHHMFMEGLSKGKIALAISEKYGLTKRPGYKWIQRYLQCPEYVQKREEVSTYIKNTLLAMYESNFAKGYYRAAMEVLDRLLMVCPWIKDKEEQTSFAPIKVEIVERKEE